MKEKVLAIGFLFFGIGVIQAVIFEMAHFYTLFSVGLAIIFVELHRRVVGVSMFARWKYWQYTLFATGIIITSIFIDIFGIDAGYWTYPSYSSVFDTVLKYVFEWGVAFLYLMASLMFGIEYCKKKFSLNRAYSFFISLILLVTVVSLFTEWINLFAHSWTVLDMPISNAKIGEFFVVFQTLGYWAMAIISYMIYLLVRRLGE